MKVILQADVKNLGKKGDLVDVAEGYARNFLIPRNLAQPATAANMRSRATEVSQRLAKEQREEEEAKRLAERMQSEPVTIAAKSGESGRLFGSVTSQDIASAVKSKWKIDIDKRKIELDEPIKTMGHHQVLVKVHPRVTATLRVHVVES